MDYHQHIKSLTKISKAITSNLYLEDILRLIVTVTAQMMGSNICSIMLIDRKKKELVIRATQSVSEDYNTKPALKIGEGIAGKVAATKKPLTIKDVREEKEYKFHDIAKKEGLCSLLCVPLEVKSEIIGVLNCYTSQPHDFTDTEIAMLTSVASQSAIAIENAELLVKSKVIQEELETRKVVERAKGVLMKKDSLTEAEAYQQLQKYSMNHRKSMREIAEAIIMVEDMGKKGLK